MEHKLSLAFQRLLPGWLVWLPLSCLAAPTATLMAFDIPARPLQQALKQYAAVTRVPMLYRSELTTHRISSPVKGRFSAEEALHTLLAGTGLQVEQFGQGDARGFVLVVAPDVPAADAPGDYAAWLQQAVWTALCASSVAAPGNYRSLLRFGIDGEGRLKGPRLLTSSGQAGRDDAILATLQTMQLNILPPSTMPQPVTLLIVPNDAQADRRCGAARGSAP